MKFVGTRDGLELAVNVVGAEHGVPVLVLPGGPCRDPSYLGDLAGLPQVRAMAVLHPRGTAATGGLSNGWWKDAADVIAVADALELDAFDLLAHSAGTRLALAVAAQHRGRVRSMALVTPSAAWLTRTGHDGMALAATRPEPEIARAIASMNGPEPTDEAAFQRAWEAENPAGYAHWTEVERRHAGVGALSFAASTAWFTDVPDDVAQLIRDVDAPPSLLIGGELDILSGVAPVRAYAQALNARLVFVSDSGHYPWVEQPTAFRKVLDPWLMSAH